MHITGFVTCFHTNALLIRHCPHKPPSSKLLSWNKWLLSPLTAPLCKAPTHKPPRAREHSLHPLFVSPLVNASWCAAQGFSRAKAKGWSTRLVYPPELLPLLSGISSRLSQASSPTPQLPSWSRSSGNAHVWICGHCNMKVPSNLLLPSR